MENAEFVDVLDRAGVLLAEAAEKAGPDAPVPSCPDWRVRDLLSHTGKVHRWATRQVAEALKARSTWPAVPDLDGAALVGWFREGHRTLVDTLAAAPADLDCWKFMPAPSPLAFWTRRQAHETVIHRADAETALGLPVSPVDPVLAADGIEELLGKFHARERSKVRTRVPSALRVRATDADAVWTVWLSEAPPLTEPDDEGVADCEVSGPVSELYFSLWNRLPLDRLDHSGDAALIRLWQESGGI